MSSTTIKQENATDIVNKHLNNYPNLQLFFQKLMKRNTIETKKVGMKFQYPKSIENYSSYGILMDYFIRKHLSNQFSIKLLKDDFTERILNEPDNYFTAEVKRKIWPQNTEKHYKIFKDSKTQAIDIVESIITVSLSTKLYYHDDLPTNEIEADNNNLLAVIKYFKELPYSSVEIKTNVACNYFEGNADLIFDQKVLYEIKTSQFPFLKRSDKKVDEKNFYKLFLYGFGYYKKTGKIIKSFRIYNPLLGLEYQIEINDIDMKHFEEVLEKDVENMKNVRRKN